MIANEQASDAAERSTKGGMTGSRLPRVTIGVPTYNRPAGLRRTLDCMLGQTFADLEVLVSDNASPDPDVAIVCDEYTARDTRIRVSRQATNVGITENFLSLLRAARGEYFMWAADDDEWAPGFVEACVALLDRGAVSAMTGFDTLYRGTGERTSNALPDLALDHCTARNIGAFLHTPTPSLFYGLHRRTALAFILDETRWFDYYDCYFVLRLITQGPVGIDPRVLFTAGVDGGAYAVKTVGKRLRFVPFLLATCQAIRGSRLSTIEAAGLQALAAATTLRLFLSQLRTRWFRVSAATR